MLNKKKLISIAAIILGSLYTITGVFSIVAYIKGSLEDLSLAYWQLLLLALGVVLIIFGIFFTITAIRSYKSDSAYRRVKALLRVALSLIVIVLVLSFLSQIRFNKDMEVMENTTEYIEKINKIDKIDIAKNNSDGFDLLISTTGGVAGKYELRIAIADRQQTFITLTEAINLNTDVKNITKNISYNGLFKKCFTEFNRSSVYVCTENTGAVSTMTIEAKLAPIQNNINNNISGLTSTEQIKIKLDTFTKNNQVNVNSFKILN